LSFLKSSEKKIALVAPDKIVRIVQRIHLKREVPMVEILKKALLASVGVTYLTKDKIEEVGKKILQDAHVNETEGRKFVDELVKKSVEAKSSLEKTVTEKIQAALHAMNLPTRNDVNELKNRIAELEAQLKK
jgi:polyhydroxyalkanoate synthesis regulator phasin